MKYRILGRTHFEVSDMAYGLWGMSGWTGSNDDESCKLSNSPLTWAAISSIPPGPTAKEKATAYSAKFSSAIIFVSHRFIGFTLRPKFLP